MYKKYTDKISKILVNVCTRVLLSAWLLYSRNHKFILLQGSFFYKGCILADVTTLERSLKRTSIKGITRNETQKERKDSRTNIVVSHIIRNMISNLFRGSCNYITCDSSESQRYFWIENWFLIIIIYRNKLIRRFLTWDHNIMIKDLKSLLRLRGVKYMSFYNNMYSVMKGTKRQIIYHL